MNKVREILESLYDRRDCITATHWGFSVTKYNGVNRKISVDQALSAISEHYKSLIPKKKENRVSNITKFDEAYNENNGFNQAIDLITEKMNDGKE